jgi:hypothetical protein
MTLVARYPQPCFRPFGPDRPLLAFEACLEQLSAGAAAAVVLCDERVAPGPLAIDRLERFTEARVLAAADGVHLVDWIACDDEAFRATRLLTLTPSEQPDWWVVGPEIPINKGNPLALPD